MKFDIKSRWDDRVQFTADINCSRDESYSIKLGLAIRAAVKAGASLANTDLADASLINANLVGGDFTRSDLSRANMTNAEMSDANLACATLDNAVLAYATLARANMARASLIAANFTDASLAGANLVEASLSRASLIATNLARANLDRVNWSCANLADAYMVDAKWGNDITLTRAPIQISNIPNGWPVTILDEHMQIGCELHTYEDWAAFDDRRILEMSGKRALAFWRANRDWLIAACVRHDSYR